MIPMWSPFCPQTEVVSTTQSCTASEVVHQELHTLSAHGSVSADAVCAGSGEGAADAGMVPGVISVVLAGGFRA